MKKVIEFLESKETYKKVYEIINQKLVEAGNDGTVELGPLLEGDIKQTPSDGPLSTYNKIVDGDKELFLCGGAVANILYYLYHKTEKPIINDVDFFVMESTFKSNKGGPFGIFSSLETKGGKDSEGGYDFVYQQEGGHRYHIINEKKDKLLNWVGVSVENYDNNDVFGESYSVKKGETKKTNKDIVLGGFDLNCTQAGLDISEGKIIYKEEFAEFLRTKQMVVTAPHTPTQTLIRLFKKVDELGCYCDIELESRFLLGAFFCDGVKQTIGDVTHKKYLKYKDKIDEHMSFVKVDIKKHMAILETYRYEKIGGPVPEPHDIGKFCRDFLGFTKFREYIDGDEELNDLIEEEGLLEKDLWMCIPKRGFEATPMTSNRELRNYKAYFNILNRGVRYIHKEKLSWFMCELKETDTHGYNLNKINYKEHILNKLGYKLGFTKITPIDDENPMVHTLKKHGLEFISCDFTKEHVDYVSRFVTQHVRVWWNIPKKNFQYSYGEIRKLMPYAKKEGGWIIGEFENYRYKGSTNVFGSLANDSVPPYSFEDFKLIVEKKKKELSEPLIEPISLEGFEYIDNVTELVTVLSLKSEGKTMGHCVGGYSDTIKGGSSRIFHVEFDGISSTLQISHKVHYRHRQMVAGVPDQDETIKVVGGDKYYKKQHYGEYPKQMGNVAPNEKNIDIAKELCEFLTEKYLSVAESTIPPLKEEVVL
jgi:hypothetical protein